MSTIREHKNCRKLGTSESDMCVCCPCGCNIPIDYKHYSCTHGQQCEECVLKQENGCPTGNHFDDNCRCQGEPIYPLTDEV